MNESWSAGRGATGDPAMRSAIGHAHDHSRGPRPWPQTYATHRKKFTQLDLRMAHLWMWQCRYYAALRHGVSQFPTHRLTPVQRHEQNNTDAKDTAALSLEDQSCDGTVIQQLVTQAQDADDGLDHPLLKVYLRVRPGLDYVYTGLQTWSKCTQIYASVRTYTWQIHNTGINSCFISHTCSEMLTFFKDWKYIRKLSARHSTKSVERICICATCAPIAKKIRKLTEWSRPMRLYSSSITFSSKKYMVQGPCKW